MRLFGAAFLAICVLAIAAQSSQAAIVTVSGHSLNVDAIVGNSLFDNETDFSTALDRSNTITATAGSSSSSATLDWSTSGNTYAKLSFDFDHTLAVVQDSYAYTYEKPLFFSVEADTTYSLSGIYELTGSSEISGFTYLRDLTAGEYLFLDSNTSYITANEKFVLGAIDDGDIANYTLGSLNGTLFTGHNYEFYFNNYIHAFTDDVAATAVGSLTLEIGTAPTTAPVPEPTTLTMWGLGAFGCAVAAYRRKRK